VVFVFLNLNCGVCFLELVLELELRSGIMSIIVGLKLLVAFGGSNEMAISQVPVVTTQAGS
jgi:hypothetical protein